MALVASGQTVVAPEKDALQHSAVLLTFGVEQFAVIHQPVTLCGGLLITSLVHPLQTAERKGIRLNAPYIQLIDTEPLCNLLFCTHFLSLLICFIFSFQRQQPVVDPLVIGIPDQPPAHQAMLCGQLVDLQRPRVDHLIAVFVHVLGLDGLQAGVAAQKGKQTVQTGSIVGPGGRGEGAARQSVGNVGFQCPLGHIDHTSAGIAHKMDGTS